MTNKITTLKSTIVRLDMRRGSSVAVDRIRGGRLKKIREDVGLRDGYTCKRCGRVTAKGQVDHIVPLHLGGQESDSNRQWLCIRCHDIKSKKEEKNRGQ